MARLATGLPATALTGLDLHQLDFNKEFHCLITAPPFPRLAQREQILAGIRRLDASTKPDVAVRRCDRLWHGTVVSQPERGSG